MPLHGKSLLPALADTTLARDFVAYSQFSKNGQMGYSAFEQARHYTAWFADADGQSPAGESQLDYGPIAFEEYYDHGADPHEVRNAAAKSSAAADMARLRSRLLADMAPYVRLRP